MSTTTLQSSGAPRVLMLAIRFDLNDWATAFIPQWVYRLSQNVQSIDVLALEVGTIGHLPSNVRVHSMGRDRGYGRAGLLRTFYSHAMRLVPACDVVFVHMIPRYALLVAPLAKLYRKPIVLWYTHRNASADLRRALPLVNRVVTAVDSSFPLPTNKLKVLGHGIDTTFFSPETQSSPASPVEIVQVARLQAIKNQSKLIAAIEQLPDACAIIIGAVPTGEDTGYLQQLRVQAQSLGERVVFTGGLSATDVRTYYRRATVAVNLSPPGLFDKAALESMACGVPTIVSNPAFDEVLGVDAAMMRIRYPIDTDDLTHTVQQVLSLRERERLEMGQRLREQVEAQHSLDALLPRLAQALAEA
jgi:glycosyltransferase involved in cell wall biosynthesis